MPIALQPFFTEEDFQPVPQVDEDGGPFLSPINGEQVVVMLLKDMVKAGGNIGSIVNRFNDNDVKAVAAEIKNETRNKKKHYNLCNMADQSNLFCSFVENLGWDKRLTGDLKDKYEDTRESGDLYEDGDLYNKLMPCTKMVPSYKLSRKPIRSIRLTKVQTTSFIICTKALAARSTNSGQCSVRRLPSSLGLITRP